MQNYISFDDWMIQNKYRINIDSDSGYKRYYRVIDDEFIRVNIDSLNQLQEQYNQYILSIGIDSNRIIDVTNDEQYGVTNETVQWFNQRYGTKFRDRIDYLYYLWPGTQEIQAGRYYLLPVGYTFGGASINPALSYDAPGSFMDNFGLIAVGAIAGYGLYSVFSGGLVAGEALTTGELLATEAATQTISGAELAAMVESGTVGLEGAFLESAALSDAAVTFSTVSGELISATLPTGEIISFESFIPETPISEIPIQEISIPETPIPETNWPKIDFPPISSAVKALLPITSKFLDTAKPVTAALPSYQPTAFYQPTSFDTKPMEAQNKNIMTWLALGIGLAVIIS